MTLPGNVFLRHVYIVALAAAIKQIIAGLCEVVHTLPTRKVPMNPCGADRPGGRCHASERDISCCDHIGDCAYHGLVNLDVAQGQGCYGAGFEQFNAAALGRVIPAG